MSESEDSNSQKMISPGAGRSNNGIKMEIKEEFDGGELRSSHLGIAESSGLSNLGSFIIVL